MVDQVGAGDQADEGLAVQHDGDAIAIKDRDQGVQRFRHLQRVQITRHGRGDRLGEAFLTGDVVGVHDVDDVALVQNADQAAVLNDRQLRQAVAAHPLEGGVQRVFRPDNHHVAGGVFAVDQVRQVAVQFALRQPLIGEPGVVVDLGQIFGAGVADEGHDPLRLGLFAAPAQGRGDQGARGRSRQNAFLQQQLAHRGDRLGVGDGIGDVDQVGIGRLRHEVLADAFDGVAAVRPGHAVVDQARQRRADGVGQNDLGLGALRLEVARVAGNRPARADPGDEGVDIAVHLLEDFRAGRLEVGFGVGVVGELVDEIAARNLLGQTLGHVGVVFGMAMRHVRAGQAHVGAHGAQVLDLLLRHLVGNDQQDVVALLLADQGQGQAGVARRGLNDGAARFQPARLLSRLDHRQGDAVLDGAAGVLALQLQEQAAGAGVDPRHLDHRRLADQVQQTLGRTAENRGVGHRHEGRLRCTLSNEAGRPPLRGQLLQVFTLSPRSALERAQWSRLPNAPLRACPTKNP